MTNISANSAGSGAALNVEFVVGSYEDLKVSDEEISELLFEVYVQAGFTTPTVAEAVFDPVKVRARGQLFVAREVSTNALAGMVTVVPPESSAVVRAKENECEMHLLAVHARCRGRGLGRELVTKAVDCAKDKHCSTMILWTQKPMKEAQGLYESFGFVRTSEMAKSGIDFLVYEKRCV